MSDAARADGHFGEGPLARAAALVYTLLVVEILFALTTAPGLVALTLLEPDASNVPLAAACALPLGPAFSAAVYAVARQRLDLTELRVAAAFWRGYKLNVAGVLRIWVPFLVVMAILGVNLGYFGAAGVPAWWGVLLVVVAVAAVLWVVTALVITSLFAFRAVDVARLAAYFLAHKFGVTVGFACLLLVAAGVTAVSSEAVLMLLASVLAGAVVLTARPMTMEIEEKFTA